MISDGLESDRSDTWLTLCFGIVDFFLSIHYKLQFYNKKECEEGSPQTEKNSCKTKF